MKRRGGVLLEVLLSIALFVGVGAFALAAMRTTFGNIDRAQRDQLAIDIARSKMAELEAGLISIADLRGQTIRGAGSREFGEDDPVWTCEVHTQRTQYRDLTLVELTVREDVRDDGDQASGARFTLRQLVQLSDAEADEYEEDDLMSGVHVGGRP